MAVVEFIVELLRPSFWRRNDVDVEHCQEVLLLVPTYVSPDLIRGRGGEFASHAMRPLNAKPMHWLHLIFIATQRVTKIGYRPSPVRQGAIGQKVKPKHWRGFQAEMPWKPAWILVIA